MNPDAAALLHDVVEGTTTGLEEIEQRFGPEVAALVAEMTENERLQPYEARKLEHRARIAGDRTVAAIYAADKLATARQYNVADRLSAAERLRHY